MFEMCSIESVDLVVMMHFFFTVFLWLEVNFSTCFKCESNNGYFKYAPGKFKNAQNLQYL